MSASRTVRRIAATALAAGSVVAVVAMPASADSDHGHGHGRHQSYANVVLGDIQYDSPGRDDWSNQSLNREWVEVTNTGRRAVNLRGWSLTDRSGNLYRFDDLRLAGRATVRVHTGRGYDTRRDVYQDSRDYIWSNYADKATLRDDRGRTVDTHSWGYRR
ncbi:lamin tail domain-containing protein [Streptomyces sp. NBC_01724]|uniref:lamin tail domain-containing protein n=1 Tax=Streptomyces TaxID=1883 RepID=UPI0028C380E1|nr:MULTISPECIES: lamin tail domain-containing protein [unclassified Streptomyces]WTE49397.1 lamin tail domain-containing protein [Streptomyces sp. NBC_01620]WTE57485.1 lamin tail domain-containing protein [Streptomyces sp. NBC_01617]WTI84997.1 lamin tail domain-containing protein [Streptomyces sp. NBC_00724]WNO62531.1 lamin tail domain-containing protein [Streptomyces sp. AM2-3-1]WSC67114.1 lamin tail domain-containing protein [Streptomyces sp. NBC_01760]